MSYGTDNDPYLDPGRGILRNLAGITTAKELEKAEANLSAAAIALLKERPVLGNFDLAHLIAIHKRLFGSLYPWAGELRTVEMNKGATRFASAEFLPQAAQTLLAELQAENLLDNLADKAYAERLAHYYSELNILHPFREGNGRTQRAFFTLLAARSDRDLAWERMDPAANVAASIAAYHGDESKLVKTLAALLVKA